MKTHSCNTCPGLSLLYNISKKPEYIRQNKMPTGMINIPNNIPILLIVDNGSTRRLDVMLISSMDHRKRFDCPVCEIRIKRAACGTTSLRKD